MDPVNLPPNVNSEDCVILFDGVCKLCNAWSNFIKAKKWALPFIADPTAAWYFSRTVNTDREGSSGEVTERVGCPLE
ncbi:MAG: hypothetical protein JKY67_07305 [Pseudomonadales bacterium]|nr:hypothetical protein [Pseudomonadales bacterium]